ncbi:MAG: class I SAM-dependent methyltransferase [Sedimentisphaerales bacterium]|nr:class I SAM-dependent methyltransferase [Sedimentisphaerales bacterium]
MKKDKKKVSREIGLEIGSICGKYFLKLDHLHYGYWTDGLEVDITNVHIAQENYANFLISHIPESAKKILDVGCGTGQIAKKLIVMGYKVDCVSPSHFLAGQARELLGNSSQIFECSYEQLQTENRYDVILFSESFQYINLKKGFEKTISLLNPDGYMLICDFFRKRTSGKSNMSGGHLLEIFHNIVSEYPLRLIKDMDITEETSPSIDVLNDTFKKAVHPTVILTQQLLENRYPFVSKIIKWAYRKKIRKINKKYFNGEKTGENFKKFKSYRLLLYKKKSD